MPGGVGPSLPVRWKRMVGCGLSLQGAAKEQKNIYQGQQTLICINMMYSCQI